MVRGVRVPFLVGLLVAACGSPQPPASTASATTSATTATTATTAAVPPEPSSQLTPVPTPASIASELPGTTSSLVFALHWTEDVVMPATATVVMDDGLVVWNHEGLWQLRVSQAGIGWIRARLDATGLLDAPGDYGAQLRPGATPPGRGVTGYRFDVPRASGLVSVLTGNPSDYEPASWIIPEQMATLGTLAASIVDADAWIPADLVTEPAARYQPAEYILHLTFRANTVWDGPAQADVDDVPWPFPAQLDTIGTVQPNSEPGQVKRCLVIPASTAEAVAAAEASVGINGDASQVSRQLRFGWRRGSGIAEVALQQLLPDQHDCRAFVQ